MSREVTAFAPASIGNLAVGFDMLGLALESIGDTVIARRSGEAGVTITEIVAPDGQPHPDLSSGTEANTASIAAQTLWNSQGQSGGVELRLHKGVPLRSGLGSSAASAVAGVVAANQLLDRPLEIAELLPYAIEGEKFASKGMHADNVAPSLFGGLVLCPAVLLPATVAISVPDGISSVVLHPDLQIDTAESRKGLAANYSMQQWLTQQGLLAGFIAACEQNDPDLFGQCLKDVIVEPQRISQVPCFQPIKDAAIDSGAFGCSLSGSGPAIFALCRHNDAIAVAAAMDSACQGQDYQCQTWISTMDAPGATVTA